VKVPSEKAIVKAILAYLNGLPGCVARKRWGGGYGVAGDPDITGCIRGRHFEFEVKRPGDKPRPLQRKRLDNWRRAGAVGAAVYSVDDVRRVLGEAGLLQKIFPPRCTTQHSAAYISQ
jgi:hypothetical protein